MTASILLTVLIIIVLLAIGGGVMALIVYGIGWLIHLVTKFDLFQSTLLALASMFAFGILAERIFSAILSINRSDLEEDDFYDNDFADEFEDDDFEAKKQKSEPYSGIPLWRQPLKQVDFSKARPNDLCPCGSGRKFKHCHGVKRTTN